MTKDAIVVRGAREHNLKDIDLELPRNKLVVVTGLSGSGKSSLAFDTIFAEGQRRYVESLSAYARQFLGRMDKPDVDAIEGLSPAISIDQKSVSHNPRSTVGTQTEIYDYLRLLYATVGIPHCPDCGKRIAAQTVQQMVDRILASPEGTKVQILSPVVRDRKGEYKKLFKDLKQQGFPRVRVNGKLGTADDAWGLKRYEKHTIEAVVDRLVVKPGVKSRLTEAVETALKYGKGTLVALYEGREETLSEHFACVDCGISLPELTHRSFSFNSPHGACESCHGLGTRMEVDPEKVIVHPEKSIRGGCFHHRVFRTNTWLYKTLANVGKEYKFTLDQPWKKLTKKQQNVVLYGTDEEFHQVYASAKDATEVFWEGYDDYEGLLTRMERLYMESESDYVRRNIELFMSTKPCASCRGTRLKREVLGVTVEGRGIHEVTAMPVGELVPWFDAAERQMNARDRKVSREILKEIRARLRFMVDVGLEYLALDRSSSTLSGGEGQRIRLATQIGSGLVGVLYILDEPSIGLHQRDNARLIQSLQGLRDLGNTLVVVEHDEQMIRSADWVVDLGPGAGEHGGRVVAEGEPEAIAANEKSLTGAYLSGKAEIPVPETRREPRDAWLVVRGARENNLQRLDVRFPLGLFTCVTGVSGSGKSTLVNDILHKALAKALHGAQEQPGAHDGVDGLARIDKVVLVDQSPIGRTPRSNPATYTGCFTPIRDLFANVPEARARGYKPGRFSFNVKGGRCEACEGDGVTRIEMHFLPDVFVSCEECKGARYNRETLEIKYKGRTIQEVLDMTVEDALAFFQHIPSIASKLQTLNDVGLGYIRLGQQAPTLSGGEAQRVKLATELSRRATGRTLYILDEPTTGLHFHDIRKLLDVLNRLVDHGNSVVVIEHNLDVVKSADWLVDLGPAGGHKGGRIVAEGPPEHVAKTDTSTGEFLREILAIAPAARQKRARRLVKAR